MSLGYSVRGDRRGTELVANPRSHVLHVASCHFVAAGRLRYPLQRIGFVTGEPGAVAIARGLTLCCHCLRESLPLYYRLRGWRA